MSTQLARQGSGFALQPNNMQEAMQMAEMLSNSQMVPQAYRGKPQDTLVAMMMGAELGLNPIQALQNIATINGKPSIYGDALLALVQSHPKFGGHTESFDDATMTASCTVWRKGEDERHTSTFSQQDAQTAKLWGKAGPWQQYPKRMLMWRARGYALRNKFADALGGLITVEEAQDMPGEQNVTPPRRERPSPTQIAHQPTKQLPEVDVSGIVQQLESIATEQGDNAFKEAWKGLGADEKAAVGIDERNRIRKIALDQEVTSHE
ncbi:MAG: recombinase RecT [Pseudomonadota bacterium]|nr:recombinase RecT [Pseudomonadota bacterium]